MFQPSPADAEAVAGAQVIIANGLGFEGWMDRLVEASGTQAALITAADGVTPIAFGEEDHAEEEGHDHAEGEEHDHDHAKEEAGHEGHDHAGHDHGAEDPHAWQSATNVALYVGNIERGLAAADPEGAETYKANASRRRRRPAGRPPHRRHLA